VAIGGRTRSTRGLVILLVVASLVIITVDFREGSSGPLSKLSDGLHSVVIPMQDAVSRVFHPVAAFFGALAHLPSQQQRINSLKAQVATANAEHVKYLQALKELQQLQALDGMAKSFDFSTTGARVIGNGVSNFEWTIEIDKGSNDGIKVDMPVIAAAGLVGKVIHVTPLGSQVLLITDFESYVATRLEDSQETGLLQGQGRQDLIMSNIALATKITKGEPVVTSGYSGGLFPSGIPVGDVSSISVDPTTGDKQVTVTPNVDFSSLDMVDVITKFNGG
jgi:rod shape-determining protein MreC